MTKENVIVRVREKQERRGLAVVESLPPVRSVQGSWDPVGCVHKGRALNLPPGANKRAT